MEWGSSVDPIMTGDAVILSIAKAVIFSIDGDVGALGDSIAVGMKDLTLTLIRSALPLEAVYNLFEHARETMSVLKISCFVYLKKCWIRTSITYIILVENKMPLRRRSQ